MNIDAIADRLDYVRSLDSYVGFGEAWLLLLRLALPDSCKEDFDRISELLHQLPEDAVKDLLNSEHLEALISVDPPLETVLVSPHEELESLEASKCVKSVREKRQAKPRRAMNSAANLLRIIRNKREHGFKTPTGPRDQEILGSAFPFLLQIVSACVAFRRSDHSRPEAANSRLHRT